MHVRLMTGLSAMLLAGGAAQAQPVGSAEEQLQRSSAVLRAQWQARAAAGLTPARVVEPSVTAGKVLTPSIDVTKAPGLPVIQLDVSAGTTGYGLLVIGFTSPTGRHSLSTFIYPSAPAEPTHASLKIELGYASSFNPGTLGLYAESGAWAVSGISLQSRDGQIISYAGSALAALFPGGTAVSVTNPNPPDVVAPSLGRGSVLTPTVSVSAAQPDAVIRLPARDALSGVSMQAVTLTGPVGSDGFPASIYVSSNLLAPAAYTPGYLHGALQASQTLGTYTITSVTVCDVAANCVYLNTPAGISTYFSHSTIDVVK